MKTELVLAFTQMPEDLQTPFKGLYPEIVAETPVAIELDPEKRYIKFTVGAREMEFGPANENYSTFMLGCYRMLTKAAQDSGWLSQYAAENAAQEASPAAHDSTPAPAAAAPASPDLAKVAALRAKLASLPQTPEVQAFAKKLAAVEGKVKTASVSNASTTVIPKPNHELFVRPLDFVGALRDDWNTWAEAHGGKDTMHEEGVLDLQVSSTSAEHHASVSELSNLSGWNHEAAVWSNPKGIKTADDSKLVSQLRKRASVDGEAQLMSNTDNPIEKLADGTTTETNTVSKTASKEEVATAKSACSSDFRSGKTSSVKKAYSPEVSSAAQKFIEQNSGKTFSIDTLREGLKAISSSWKDVAAYLKDSDLLRSDGPGLFKLLNRDTANDQSFARRRFASVKTARDCNAEPVDKMFGSFDVRIDCPAGATVSGVDKEGNAWESIQSIDYGELPETTGGDGEPIDVFLGPDENSNWVFIVNQTKTEGEEVVPDEIKVGLGFWSMEEARDAYLSMFDPGWSGFDPNLVTTTVDAFNTWLNSGETSIPEVSAENFDPVEAGLPTQQPSVEANAAPEPVNFFTATPEHQYRAASTEEIHAGSLADTLTMFHDPKQRMDHTASTLATMLSGVSANPLRGHTASVAPSIKDSVKISHEAMRGDLIAVASSSRIAEIITNDLNCGMSPEECDHRASTVGYYGNDAMTFRKVLAKVAGISGELVLQPNFVKNSCVATHAALNGPHKATRKKTPYYSVASTSACAGCKDHVADTAGSRRCSLFGRPIVSSVEEMHSLADKVWGKDCSKEKTASALSKRAVAHLASKRASATMSPIQRVTAATGMSDGAEDRPAPAINTTPKTPEVSPSSYVAAALCIGQTPSKIAEIIDRSVTLQPSFKQAALASLESQKGMMGFLTVLPHFAGTCSATHGKHFASTAKGNDKRKYAFHSVTKIAACSNCGNCIKSASNQERCTLYGKPLVANLTDLKRVVAQVYPALETKIAAMSKEELVSETIPYLAKALGLPEDHPSLRAYTNLMPTENGEGGQTVTESEDPEIDTGACLENPSKNVMELALDSSKPKTELLEDIAPKIKEAVSQNKTAAQIYDGLKGKIAGMDNRDLKVYVNRIASTYINESRNSEGEISTEVITTDHAFSQTLSELAKNQIKLENPSLSDGVVDLAELGHEPEESLMVSQVDDTEPKIF